MYPVFIAGLIPVSGQFPWSRKWQPTPVILPGKSPGQRSLVGCNPWGRRESDRTEHTHTMLVAALFAVARLRKPSMCPSIDKWIKTLWYSYTGEYSSATKKNYILSFVAVWMGLENVLPNEMNQRQIVYDTTNLRN